VFDPLTGSTPIQTLTQVSSVQLGITDHPLIVEIEPARLHCHGHYRGCAKVTNHRGNSVLVRCNSSAERQQQRARSIPAGVVADGQPGWNDHNKFKQ
jgi:hypothetical protein